MFNFLKRKSANQQTSVTLKITGMHCTSCSLAIDDALEETQGVVKARTSYARSETVVHYDHRQAKREDLLRVVKGLGYVAEVKSK